MFNHLVQFTPLYAGMAPAYPQLAPPLGGGLVQPLGLNAVPNKPGAGPSPDGKQVTGKRGRVWALCAA
jgi:hypothetical protein